MSDTFLQVTGFDPLVVTAPAGAQGPMGQQGVQGATGPAGPQGPIGPAGGVSDINGHTGSVDLTGTYVPWAKATLVNSGDSITANNLQSNAVAVWSSTTGFWTWANAYAGGRLRLLANRGHSGYTSTQLLALFQSEVIALAPGYCHILWGTNDPGNSISAATTKANILSAINQATAAGIKVLLGTILPQPSGTWSNAQLDAILGVNLWIRRLGRTNPNVTVIDYATVLTDPAGTGYSNPSWLISGPHPNAAGAKRMGFALAQVINQLVPPSDVLALSGRDNYLSSITPLNLAKNPMYSGTAGTLVGGATGAIADSTNLQSSGGTTTGSKVARTDTEPGTWQKVVTAGDTSRVYQENTNAGTLWHIGDTITGRLEFYDEGTWTAASNARLTLLCIGGSGVTTAYAFQTEGGDTVAFTGEGSIKLMETPPLTIPSGTTDVAMYIDVIATAATWRVSRLTVRVNETYP